MATKKAATKKVAKKVVKKVVAKKAPAKKAKQPSFVWEHPNGFDVSKPRDLYGKTFAFRGDAVIVDKEIADLLRRRGEFREV